MDRDTLAVLLAALVILPVAGALPTPGQDDAGSGGDAGDRHPLALPIGEGSYQGNLSARSDDFDWYRFDPPPNSLVRIEVGTEDSVAFEIFDSRGVSRRWGEVSGGTADAFDIGAPSGPWTLAVGEYDLSSLDTDVPYTFTITFEHHDHLVHLEGREDRQVSLFADIPDADPAWMYFEFSPRSSYRGEPWGFVKHFQLVGTNGEVDFHSTVASSPISPGEHVVWTHNVGPAHAEVPIPYPEEDVGPEIHPLRMRLWRWPAVLPMDGFNLSIGAASTHGVHVEGWVLWDGSNATVTNTTRGATLFATASDFEGDGQGVQVGPYGQADDLNVGFEAEHESTFVFAVANTPPFAREPTRMEVAPPQAETVNLVDRNRAWWPEMASPGAWNATLVHTDGLEQSTVRFMAASFPIEPVPV